MADAGQASTATSRTGDGAGRARQQRPRQQGAGRELKRHIRAEEAQARERQQHHEEARRVGPWPKIQRRGEQGRKRRVEEVGETVAVEDQRGVAVEHRADRAVEHHPVGAEGVVVEPDLAGIGNGREQDHPDIKRDEEARDQHDRGRTQHVLLRGNDLRRVPSPCVVLPGDALFCCGRMRIGLDFTTTEAVSPDDPAKNLTKRFGVGPRAA